MEIRRIEPGDENQVSNLIRKTISISNIKDYPKELMDVLIAIETPEHVLQRASWTHFYVVVDKNEIIGCGAIELKYLLRLRVFHFILRWDINSKMVFLNLTKSI